MIDCAKAVAFGACTMATCGISSAERHSVTQALPFLRAHHSGGGF